MKTTVIAVIQLHPKKNEIESNHQRALSFIREAAASGAQLAVLPEYHLADFSPSYDPSIRQKCANWKRYLDAYCAIAKELNICVVPGSLGELHDDDSIVNAAYFIDNTGAVCGKYEKKNLWHSERGYVKGSKNETRHIAFDTPLGKVGLLICWDLAFPEAFRELIAQGAKMIIIPAFWKYSDAGEVGMKRNPKSEGDFVDAAVVSRAFENTAAVVFCNVAGPIDGGYAGLSQVAMPFLGRIERFKDAEEGMKIVEVDMNILEEAEDVYKIREDMASSDWHYGYRK
ncbi:hypothetical protein N7476_002560 [Penicillium atrosanguineum]|uniref:CN hydrolase domain-containing protein n=1 Tax=Penicillium atrosanguineum TaxID=1132637 RepID=A0A9W9U7R6_9EURO|nr:hypothetical protein N7526_005587 [Penicillium atrosanguineum]KAJ5323960.1 hypothetical protein N7476_002560 [Penicillium atrosanguineum]